MEENYQRTIIESSSCINNNDARARSDELTSSNLIVCTSATQDSTIAGLSESNEQREIHHVSTVLILLLLQ